jgi:hypothetical protein
VAKGHKLWVSHDKHAEHYSNCLVGLNVHRSPVITRECFKNRVHNRPARIGVPKGLELCKEMPAQEGTGFWNDGNLPAAHVNPRFFEMAACGTLVVSDASRAELGRMFPMAPRAEDPDHFVELVLYYIAHPEEAQLIGEACSFLISKRHSYKHRAAEALILAGLMDAQTDDRLSSLGVPGAWRTPQDFAQLKESWSSVQTGPSERWSPQFGMSSTRVSGSPSESDSLDVPTPW